MEYWLFGEKSYKSAINVVGNVVTIDNGLIKRVVDGTIGTTSLYNYAYDCEILSSKVQDLKIVIDKKDINFYKEAKLDEIKIISTIKDVEYTPNFATENRPYPPIGNAVEMNYTLEKLKFKIIYEIFDNVPVISKRVHLTNNSGQTITINSFFADYLCIDEEKYSQFYGETNYNGGCGLNNNRTLSVIYDGKNCVKMGFDLGPEAEVKSGEIFTGLRVYELVHTAKYYEQKMMEVKAMYRVICPWVLENPLIFHITSSNKFKLKKAIDKIAGVGFNMLIQSFGSRINVENVKDKNIEKYKKIYSYAHSKNIKIGGYTLAIVKNYLPVQGPECNPLPDKSKIMRCLATEWSKQYWKNILEFYDKTKADCIEIDGPYHFYECNGGKTHLHKGHSDSKYMQWKLSNEDIFKEFKNRNIYINTPDWMYLNGVNRCGIGYEEIAFSEPRQHQLISSRIYNYKGTFNKIPSMAWSFLPINQYHGGGKSACFSPLEKNIFDYEWSLFQHIMSGVIPCFRGKNLYEGILSETAVKTWINFYKKYKQVLNGNTVHFMPPIISDYDKGRTTDIDCILNCVSSGEVRGILAVFNQTDKHMEKTIKVPIFYTGLTDLKQIPAPYIGSGITEVKNPVYGEYPPPFPTSDDAKELYEAAKVTGYGKTQVIKEKIEETKKVAKIKGKISFYEKESVKQSVEYDENGDAFLKINLMPLSYTYFIIKAL